MKIHVNKISSFFSSDILYYSSSLSFYTIFSLIPILLILLSVFTSMSIFDDFYDDVKMFIFSNIIPSNVDLVSKYLDRFLSNSSKGGLLGIAYAVFASVMFLLNYDYVINKIFTTKGRSFLGSLILYALLNSVLPIILALFFYLLTYMADMGDKKTYALFYKMLLYLVTWFIFFAIFKISANMRVSNKSAIISSFISSLIWYLFKSIFINYIAVNKIYLNIYGSFSILIFLFLWIYISWIILLYGMKLCKILNDEYKLIDINKENS